MMNEGDLNLIEKMVLTVIQLTHHADTGLKIKHKATADGVILTLQTGEDRYSQGDVLGAIEFQAPDETTGTDAIVCWKNRSSIRR